ncbi:MAG: energy-coupling factor transporter transmembrane protein EcfT [Treponema sp.]|nr:energy-coupling factor transporter transmembrane protein EcfT [Treponema sp.]
MSRIITYKEKDCFVHRLSGITKLIFFLLWTLTSMLTYDARVLGVMFFISIFVFAISKTEWKQVRSIFMFILFFLIVNILAIFLFSPYEGCEIYNSRTELFHIAGNYSLTKEQLFYEFNIILKYFTIVPSVFMFVSSTNPSEFASSLNKLGLPYTVSYSVAIALRYIPDVQTLFTQIKNAQEARGIEMSKKEGIFSRLKNMAAILFPLIFSSMERIDSVSDAMELRGFGKKKKRSWYAARKLTRADLIVMIFTIAFCTAALVFTYYDGTRFYNPFI